MSDIQQKLWDSADDDTVESLRQQLAAALAACKLKDEALELSKWREQYSLTDCPELYEEALATQPDDSALRSTN